MGIGHPERGSILGSVSEAGWPSGRGRVSQDEAVPCAWLKGRLQARLWDLDLSHGEYGATKCFKLRCGTVAIIYWEHLSGPFCENRSRRKWHGSRETSSGVVDLECLQGRGKERPNQISDRGSLHVPAS